MKSKEEIIKELLEIKKKLEIKEEVKPKEKKFYNPLYLKKIKELTPEEQLKLNSFVYQTGEYCRTKANLLSCMNSVVKDTPINCDNIVEEIDIRKLNNYLRKNKY